MTGNRTALVCTLAVLTLGLCIPAPAFGATPEEVKAALEKGKAWLLSVQKDGNWESAPHRDAAPAPPAVTGGQWGGQTALATYALLAAGADPKDPAIQKAVKFLSENEMYGIYAVGLRAQVWLLLPPDTKGLPALVKRDATFLLNAIEQKGRGKGFYNYVAGPGLRGEALEGWSDRSVSQYGVLGMWALDQAGFEVPTPYWKFVDTSWREAQLDNGAWNYREDNKAEATMAAAGIATLYITEDYLLRANPFNNCQGGIADNNIQNGLNWMDKHIDELLGANNFYGMYGVERIGVASGHKYFGAVDWYQVGSDFLVKAQQADGRWDGGRGGAEPSTAFSLLFLARSSAPIMVNKLEYQLAGKKGEKAWNERPRDAANLARWVGRKSETFLNWQIVNLKVSADDLHDAPILYIAGSEALDLSPEDVVKLRTFVEQGGMIVGNSDCDKEAFTVSFQKLGKKLFPKYEFHPLPQNHLIYTGETFLAKAWRSKPRVMALSNEVRELMLLIPEGDPGRFWQNDSYKTKQELFELAADIFFYATDKKNLRAKGETYIVRPDSAIQPAGSVKVARLMAGDNPDPEPGGWERLKALMHNTRKIDLVVDPVKPGEGKLAGYRVAHLTGTVSFVLSAAQRAELHDFVEKGGTLVVDAAGGSSPFATAAESELAQIFGKEAANELARPLPTTADLYTIGDVPLDKVSYREFAKLRREGHGTGGLPPRLRGITVKGRLGVIYSREDLSAGLVGEPVDGIVGYDPKSATALMTNIILYANGSKPIPSTGPTTAPSAGRAEVR